MYKFYIIFSTAVDIAGICLKGDLKDDLYEVWYGKTKTMTNDVCHLMQQRQGDVGRRKQSDSKSPDDDGRRILFYDNGKDDNRRILFKDGQKLRRVSE